MNRYAMARKSKSSRKARRQAVKEGQAAIQSSSAEEPVQAVKASVKTNPASSAEIPKGFNRIPYWLRYEKHMSDFTAGTLVVLVGGVAIILLFYVLVLVWPAR